MIASTRGLAVLAAIALALGIVVIIDRSGVRAPIDRTLVPGFDADHVSGLEISGVAVAKAGASWRLSDGPADTMTVDAVLAALRGARWHRRAERSRAGTPRAILRVLGSQPTTLAIGAALPGAGQTWIVRDDSAYLVDDWVAHALAPSPLELHVRHPLAGAAAAKQIAISAPPLRIEGERLVEPTPLYLDPALLAALFDACEDVAIVELAPPPAARELEIRIDDTTLTVGGACGADNVHVTGGCAPRAAIDRLRAAITALARPPAQIADKRPLPFTPDKLGAIASPGFAGARSNRGAVAEWIDLHDAELAPERVRALLAALATPADIVPRPNVPPRATLVAAAGATQLALELFDRVVARPGEPFALRPPRDAWAVIAQPLDELRDITAWREDATTITAITIDGVTYTRGAVLGEWTREPSGAFDGALVDALVEAIATVRGPPTKPPLRIAHRVSLIVTPPTGAPFKHELALGAPSAATGCAAHADNRHVFAQLALCTAVIALGQ